MNATRQTLIFLIIGSLTLSISYFLLPSDKRPEFLSAAFMNRAFVIIAIGLLNIVWWLAGGEPISRTLNDSDRKIQQSLQLLDDSRNTGAATLNELRHGFQLIEDSRMTGLQRVLTVSREFELRGGDWMDRLNSAQASTDLMGFSLLIWTKGQNFIEQIINTVRRGVNVRILIMDPDHNDYFHSFVNKYQIVALKDDAAVISEVRAAQHVFEHIAQEIGKVGNSGHGVFEFRTVKKGLICCQICRTDDELVAIPYLFSVVASESPLIVAHGESAGLYQSYRKEFDKLWMLNGPGERRDNKID